MDKTNFESCGEKYSISNITAKDDAAIAAIIRDNLKKFKLDIPGTAFFDPELDHLSEFYNAKPDKRAYFILKDSNCNVVGGVGFAEFSGLENCAEIQKLYLEDSVKGQGLGQKLMSVAEHFAQQYGYKNLYLETHTNLLAAIKLYEKIGFISIKQPIPTIHTTMNRFYLKKL